MAEQRSGDVIQKIDHSGSDGRGGLLMAEHFKQVSSGRDLNIGDIDGGGNLSGNSSGVGGGETVNGDDAQMISDFLESVHAFVNDGGMDDILSDQNFENPDFGSGGGEETDDDVKREDTNGSDGFVGNRIRRWWRSSPIFDGSIQGSGPRRIGLRHLGLQYGFKDSEDQEFGQDTNRLDYFRVTPFDVNGDDHLTGISSHGGGSRDRGMAVGPSQEHERGNNTDVAGGGIRIRRVSANNDNRLGQAIGNGRGGGGRRGRGIVGSPRPEEERGGATAGAGGYDRTREAPVGISANIGSDGGEALVRKWKHEGRTVAVPVAMVVVAAVMMMVMVIAVVVLVLVRW